MQTFSILASLCSWTGWIELYMVANPKDRFSHIEAQIIYIFLCVIGQVVEEI